MLVPVPGPGLRPVPVPVLGPVPVVLEKLGLGGRTELGRHGAAVPRAEASPPPKPPKTI